jgi:transposase
VVDAREVRLKAHRPTQKSDRRDAFELCDGLRGIYRAIVHVPPAAVTRLRELLGRRRHFVRLETAQVNAVKRLLRGAGLGHLSRSLGTEVAWAKLLATLAGHGELRDYVEPHRALWRCARAQRTALEAALTAHVAAPAFAAHLRRLQTIPGGGPIVAATVVAVFSDVRRFADAKHAASYAGRVPATYHSGDREAYGRITKRGSGESRAMLCEAAHHASRPTHPLHPYFASLCAKRGYKMATIAVAHRLARITFAMLRDGTDFDVAQLNIEEGPF